MFLLLFRVDMFLDLAYVRAYGKTDGWRPGLMGALTPPPQYHSSMVPVELFIACMAQNCIALHN
jgi:hypothetical protein